MTCQHAEPLLALYAGDDLGPRDAEGVRRHVLACASCARTVEELASTVRWVSRQPRPDPGPDAFARLRRTVRQRIEAEAARPHRGAWMRRLLEALLGAHAGPAMAAAALLVVAGGAISVALLRAPSTPSGLSVMRGGVTLDARPPASPGGAEGDPASASLKAESSLSHGEATGEGSPAGALKDEAGGPPLLAQAPAGGDDDLDGTHGGRLRIELRTPDPDVRIIWFGEREGVAADK
jgi:hypothetical protein